MKNFLSAILLLSFCSVSLADFDVKQFKAQAVTSRVLEDSSQLQTTDDPPVPLGPVVVSRSEPKPFPPQPATYVKVYPLEGKQFGENLIARASVYRKTATAQLMETTPEYVVYAFTQAGTHEVSFKQIGQNPLDYEEKDVIVIVGGGGSGPGPVDPPPPISGAVSEASRKGATALNDPATASAMASALRGAIAQATGKPIDEQKLIVRSAIETVLLNRKGESRTKDWLALWREPVNNAIAGENPQANYLSLIQQAADGLSGTSAFSSSLPVITMYSMSNCRNCELFKEVDIPRIKFASVSIDYTASNPAVLTYPSFMIECYGKRMMAEGYHTAAQLQELISYMAVQ